MRMEILFLMGVAGLTLLAGGSDAGKVSPEPMAPPAQGSLRLASPAFAPGGMIPARYACDGANVNPPLEISGIPEDAQSLALIIDDPDAPMGVWTHWLIWNIAPGTRRIAENSVPSDAIQGETSFKRVRYNGPCPPGGLHHYHFKLFALDTRLKLPAGSDKNALASAIRGHTLAQTELIGTYRR